MATDSYARQLAIAALSTGSNIKTTMEQQDIFTLRFPDYLSSITSDKLYTTSSKVEGIAEFKERMSKITSSNTYNVFLILQFRDQTVACYTQSKSGTTITFKTFNAPSLRYDMLYSTDSGYITIRPTAGGINDSFITRTNATEMINTKLDEVLGDIDTILTEITEGSIDVDSKEY